MTGLVGRSSRRWLSRHPGQLILSVVGVALGVGVVVSMELAIQSAHSAFELSVETVGGRATHRVVGGPVGVPDSTVAAIGIHAGVDAAAPVVEGWVSVGALPDRPLLLLGVDPFSELPFRPWLAGERGGLDVSALMVTPGAALLAASTAAEAGLVPGDTFRIHVGGRRRPAVLLGLLRPEDELSRRSVRDLVIMDLSWAQTYLDRAGRVDRIDLRLPEGTREVELEERVRSVLPPEARLEPAGARSRSLSRMVRAFDLNLTALSLLALVFGMFLIYNTITFSVVQRRELLGTYRALGVTRREVLGLVLGETAVLGLVGTVMGLAMGAVLGRGLVRLVTRTINDLYFVVTVDGLSLPPETFVKGAAMGLGASLLAALPPAREAALATPRTAMTRSEVEVRARAGARRAGWIGLATFGVGGLVLLLAGRSVVVSFAGLFGVVLGMALVTPVCTVWMMRAAAPLLERTVGILGILAARGVVTSLSRTGPAVAALVVAVSVTVGLGTMIDSFRSTLVRWLDGTLQADVYVSPPSTVSSRAQGVLDAALIRAMERAPGVSGVSTYRATEFRSRYGPTRLVALGLDVRGEASFDFARGDPESAFRGFRREEAVLISEPFAGRHELGVGAEVRLDTEAGPRAFPVAGVFYDYGSDQGVIMMSRRTYDRYWSDAAVTSLGFFAAPGVSPHELVETLRGAAARSDSEQAVVIRSNQALRDASLEVFDRTFAITAVLRMLAFVVAFIGTLSALMALQLERSRELGVLRANGLTPGQVWQLVTAQTGAMGLAAGVLAVPAGLVLAAVMVFVVNKRSFGWTLRMDVGPELLIQAVALAVAGALLAGLYPAWRMSRTRPALALREE